MKTKFNLLKSFRASALMLVLIIIVVISVLAIMVANMSSGGRTIIEKNLKLCQTQNFFDSVIKIVTPLLRGELKDNKSVVYKKLYEELVKPKSDFKGGTLKLDLLADIFFNPKSKPSSIAQRKILLDRLLEVYGGERALKKLTLEIKIDSSKFGYYKNVYLNCDREKYGSLVYILSVNLNGQEYSQEFYSDVKVVSRVPELLGKFNLFIRNALKSNVSSLPIEKRVNRFNIFENAPDASKLSNKANVFILTNGDSKKNGEKWLNWGGGDYTNFSPSQIKLRKKIINDFGWIYLGTRYNNNPSNLFLNLTYGKYNINVSEDFQFFMQDHKYSTSSANPERVYIETGFKHDYWEIRSWKMGVCSLDGNDYYDYFTKYYDNNKSAFDSSILHLFGKPGAVSPTLVLGKVFARGLKLSAATLNYDKVATNPVLQAQLITKNGVNPPTNSPAPAPLPWTPLPFCTSASDFNSITSNGIVKAKQNIFKYFIEDTTDSDPSVNSNPVPALNGYNSLNGYKSFMSSFFTRIYNESIDYIITGNGFRMPPKTMPARFYYTTDENINNAPSEFLSLVKNPLKLYDVLKSDTEIKNFLLPKVAWDFKNADFVKSMTSKGLLYERNVQPLENVLTVDGIIQFHGNITIDSIFVERGGMIITDGNITLKGNIRLNHAGPDALLVIYTTKGNINIKSTNGHAEIWASLMAPNGTIETDGSLSVYGNMVMDHLFIKKGPFVTNIAKYGGTLDYNSTLGILPNNSSFKNVFMISFNEALYK